MFKCRHQSSLKDLVGVFDELGIVLRFTCITLFNVRSNATR